MIDGEGTVTLTQEHRNERRRLVVSISSTERALLEFVKCNVDAGQITNKRTYDSKHTPSYTYKITNRQALELLRQIQPCMQGYKAERAEYALKGTSKQQQLKDHFEKAFLEILPHNVIETK